MADAPYMYRYRASGQTSGVKNGTTVSSAANLSYNEINGFKIEPIYEFIPKGKAWLEKGLYVSDSAAPIFSPSEGDLSRNSFVIGVQLTRTINNKEQRIVVSGDADYLNNKNSTGLEADAVMSWLMNNKYPVFVSTDVPTDRKVTISFNGARMLYLTYLYVVPGLLLLTGAVILIRRKRK